jgi:hypothetical protein
MSRGETATGKPYVVAAGGRTHSYHKLDVGPGELPATSTYIGVHSHDLNNSGHAKPTLSRHTVHGASPESAHRDYLRTTREAGVQHYAAPLILREIDAQTPADVQPVIVIRSGPGNKADRHWYTAEALAQVVANKLLDGAKCFEDHPTPAEDEAQPERTIRRLAGWFSDAKLIDYNDPERGRCTAIQANFHPQADNDKIMGILRTCAEYSQMYPDKSYIGFSINAYGDGSSQTIEGEQWNRVDVISGIQSVDIVTAAGAGGRPINLQESYRMATATPTPAEKEAADKAAALQEAEDKRIAAIVDRVITLREAEAKKGKDGKDGKDGADGDDGEDGEDGKDGLDGEDGEDGEDATKEAKVPANFKKFDKMTAAQLKAAAKEAETREAAIAAREKKVTESERRAKKLTESASATARKLRESSADAVIAEMGIPTSFAPRLRFELLEGLRTPDEMKAHAKAFDNAFIRPHLDGAGALRESSHVPAGMTFSFDD